MKARFASALVALLAGVACMGSYSADRTVLSLEGVSPQPIAFTLDELRKFPRARVGIPGDKKGAVCEGVTVASVLSKAGVELGHGLRGKRLLEYLVAQGRDGYAVVFALAEVDPAFTDNPVVLCFAVEGQALDDKIGPLRIVAPADRRPARSVRQVERLVIRRDSN